MKERRKIVKAGNNWYQVRKPEGDNGEWHQSGRNYNAKGRAMLLRQHAGSFDFEIDEKVKEDLEAYEQARQERKQAYSAGERR